MQVNVKKIFFDEILCKQKSFNEEWVNDKFSGRSLDFRLSLINLLQKCNWQ